MKEKTSGRAKKTELIELVRARIDSLRPKLLDLSRRNPLIATKFSPRGSSYIRVVDELPDVLFFNLSGQEKMKFVPLPPLDEDPKDEQDRKFKNAFASAQLTDELYRAGSDAIDPASDGGLEKSRKLDRELRDRVRELLGMPPRAKKEDMSLVRHAKNNRISASYDLPNVGDSKDDGRHTDQNIQTLLLPDDLDRVLNGMTAKSRGWIQETGLNVLHAAFGFLEWTEANGKDASLAPLVLVPVEINKVKTAAGAEFWVKGIGEEGETNSVLAEKLRLDFDLRLPPFEGGSVEEYFEKIKDVSPKGSNWRIRRQVAFGVFPSARMAMYHDLDTANNAFSQHEVLVKLLGGGSSGGATPFADEYEVDEPDIEAKVPCLVMDADSSQFSAMVDIAQGQNLALEGPPGTGKSQTIVNTIAAALAEGKKVLFVAEKMAALDVVKSRLEAVGLGEFVLPLQAERSTREQVIGSLRARLEMSVGRASRQYEQKLQQYRTARSELAAYVETVSAPFARTGLSVYDVIWQSISSNELLEGKPAQLRRQEIADIGSFDRLKIDELKSLAEAAEKSGLQAAISAELWRDVKLTEMDRFAAEDLCEQASNVAVAYKAEMQARSLLSAYGFDQDASIDELEKLCSALNVIHSVPRELDFGLLEKLVGRETYQQVTSFFGDCARCLNLEADLTKALRNPMDGGWSGRLEAAAAICDAYVLETPSPTLLASRREAALLALSEIDVVRDSVRSLCELLPESEYWRLGVLDKAHDLIAGAGRAVLSARREALSDPTAITIIRRLTSQGAALRERQIDLEGVIAVAGDVDVVSMRSHLATIRQAGPFAILSSRFRAAKRTYLSITRRQSFDKANAIDDMARLLDWKDAEQQFLQSPQVAEVFGLAFVGLATDFDLYERLADFYASVDSELTGASNRNLRNHLKVGDIDVLDAFPATPDSMSDWTLSDLEEEYQTIAREIDDLAAVEGKLIALMDGYLEDFPRGASSLRELGARHGELLSVTKRLLEDRVIADLLGKKFEGPKTNRASIEEELKVAEALLNLGRHLEPLLKTLRSGLVNEVKEALGSALMVAQAAREALSLLCAQSDIDTKDALVARKADEIFEIATKASLDSEGLYANAHYARCRKDLDDRGFGWLVPTLLAEKQSLEGLPRLLEALISRAMARQIYKDFGPVLSRCTGLRLDECRKQIKELDRAIILLSRQNLRAKVHQAANPPYGNSVGKKSTWTDLALIENEISKRKRHIPVRDLTKRAAQALLELKPCWMMSPLAVAQYLPKESLFDLTIIDEASQMTPEDAVGALARGEQAMVVGDTNQLPPTSFFRKMVDDDELNEDEAVLNESILEMANATFKPPRRLRWHYRSRHSSLIKFSNHLVYDDNLIVFPSANESRSDMGVSLVAVKGKYKAGANSDEARVMVDSILAFMRTQPNRSLGVVTLNQVQRDLVQAEMDFALSVDQVAQRYIDVWREKNDGLEEFFIKNLENVQGDERDVIFIGTVYGPEEYDGPVMQRFGPINGLAGKRRLNVLFSRAKQQIVTFSSMTAADIKAEEDGNAGPYMLKRWLEYSATGVLHTGKSTFKEPDSDFEIFVMDQVRAMGCIPVPQVGVAGYFIDIGVKHPEWPHGFILAIECDGANYHSSKSARDRDRLRQEVLENLGWRFHRIWSTDWFSDYRKETERLRERIAERLKELKAESVSYSTPREGAATKKQEPHVGERANVERPMRQAEEQDMLSSPRATRQPSNGIEVGDTVRIQYLSGDRRILQVTLSEHINAPKEGIVHFEQPLGQALLGAEEGDEVELLVGSYVRKAVVEKIEKAFPVNE